MSSIRSAKSRRRWSPAWATRNTSSSSKIQCPDCALYWESLQKGIDSWTEKDTTPCQFQATLSKRILPTVPDVDHLCGRPCTTKNMTRKHKSGGKMARWLQIPQVFVRYRVDWGTDHSIWCNRIGRSFLRGYMSRKKSKRKILGHLVE